MIRYSYDLQYRDNHERWVSFDEYPVESNALADLKFYKLNRTHYQWRLLKSTWTLESEVIAE